MTILDLAIAKQHLRVEGADDDAVVEVYLGAAEAAAAQFMGRMIYVDEAAMAGDADGVVVNFAIKAAVLLICGSLYANREDTVVGVSVAELPGGSKMLLQPYRIGMGV